MSEPTPPPDLVAELVEAVAKSQRLNTQLAAVQLRVVELSIKIAEDQARQQKPQSK
jgi:hypothetical protein